MSQPDLSHATPSYVRPTNFPPERCEAETVHDPLHEPLREAAQGEPANDATIEMAFERELGPWVVEVGAATGTTTRVLREGEGIVLGSSAGVDVRIADRAVSARHCRVRVDRGCIVVEDLGSKNGVFVGGGRVERAVLPAGASFVVGRAVITCGASAASDLVDDAPVEPIPGVVAGSLAMQRVVREVRRLAPVRGPVLFRGETGTGKDVLARALHAIGPRRGRPFLPLNVGTLPRELADAELFGHERGAFTGAIAPRDGAFVEAHGGTLFLDEIAELAPDLQVKLLRVLEDGEVRAVGGKGRRKVDVRIASATWAPLERRVGEGSFRHDLYQRLAVFIVEVPPLRERRSDILALAEKTLVDLRDEVGVRELTPAAAARLATYGWPGNVRELRNVVYRAALSASGRLIRTSEIADALTMGARVARPSVTPDEARAVVDCAGNVSAAARRLGVPRSTLRGWLKR